ncbi:DUF488 domain-containing protein [Virgibacillus xinjiangensis]|uniref:DUF488 domain-containing protein n=1 Tax=Virgibacillus xinjiangensis TaxID=393090 RepID=A0ABV7CUE7_9BACI
MTVKVKRIYEKQESDDGLRILVDRVWPRGVAKKEAVLDHWLKEVAPSTELRKWFGHDADKFSEFSQKYREELAQGEQKEAWDKLENLAREQDVTLVFAAKDTTHNQAVVLKELLEK